MEQDVPFLGVGCAGWSIPKQCADRFPAHGTHLERYAQHLPVVEIDSSFRRSHRPSTYAHWAASVPDPFRFAVKMPKEITHTRRLADATEVLEGFLGGIQALGAKLGPLLIQLPPPLSFDVQVAEPFFSGLRTYYPGQVVCEPRHRSWFTEEAGKFLWTMRVARATVDPAITPEGAGPGGWRGLGYYRLHGAPRMYYSSYDDAYLDKLAKELVASARARPTWCIFDNTALGAATANALGVMERIRAVAIEESMS
jgi:uncharacterized protein YecE (DUF72 family)